MTLIHQGKEKDLRHKKVLALVLAGGAGTRLKDLTHWRAKPAVPFGGKFRIIDFALSNCVNSGIRNIGVLTQYKAHSLIKHLQKAWGGFNGELGEFVEILPAQQRVENSWYKGTADAIYQNLDIIKHHNPDYVLILAGDHVYKTDYRDMLEYHIDSDADMTVGAISVNANEAKNFGIMQTDADQRVTQFMEKPSMLNLKLQADNTALASMGFYLFNTEFLCDLLHKDAHNSQSSHDFGKDIIPEIIKTHHIGAYPFSQTEKPYWRDVGTIDAFWKANLELIDVVPELDLYDQNWPIWTYQAQLPPAKFVFNDDNRRGYAVDSMVSGGCIISGASINHSVLFNNVRVNSFSHIEDSVVMSDVTIGRNCRINNAIIDKRCTVPDNTVIGEDNSHDRSRFEISEGGVVLVTQDMLKKEVSRAA